MTGAEVRSGYGAMVEVRPDTTKALRFGTAVRQTVGYDAPPGRATRDLPLLKTLKRSITPRNETESGVCRVNYIAGFIYDIVQAIDEIVV